MQLGLHVKYPLFDIATKKGTSSRKCIEMYDKHVYFLHVSTSHVAVFRDVRYKGWVHRDITNDCEPTHSCKTPSFKNTQFKIHINF